MMNNMGGDEDVDLPEVDGADDVSSLWGTSDLGKPTFVSSAMTSNGSGFTTTAVVLEQTFSCGSW